MGEESKWLEGWDPLNSCWNSNWCKASLDGTNWSVLIATDRCQLVLKTYIADLLNIWESKRIYWLIEGYRCLKTR